MLCSPNILHNLIKLTNLFCGVEQELKATTEVNTISNRNILAFLIYSIPGHCLFRSTLFKEKPVQQRSDHIYHLSLVLYT